MFLEYFGLLLLLRESLAYSVEKLLRFPPLVDGINILVYFVDIGRNFYGLQVHVVHPDNVYPFLDIGKNNISNHWKLLTEVHLFLNILKMTFAPYSKKNVFLMDLNFEAMEIVAKCLRMKFEYDSTTEYFREVDINTVLDFRTLADGKKDKSQFESYTQVFEEKHGFLNNLSILDLLFNEGRYALDYLKNQELIVK